MEENIEDLMLKIQKYLKEEKLQKAKEKEKWNHVEAYLKMQEKNEKELKKIMTKRHCTKEEAFQISMENLKRKCSKLFKGYTK